MKMNGVNVIATKYYEYLGVKIDKNLILKLTEHLEKTYKKVTWRVEILTGIRHIIGPEKAETT